MELLIINTELGTFFEVNKDAPFIDCWRFECPVCRIQQYMDLDQWEGRVSVLCEQCGKYHEQHDYRETLILGLKEWHSQQL